MEFFGMIWDVEVFGMYCGWPKVQLQCGTGRAMESLGVPLKKNRRNMQCRFRCFAQSNQFMTCKSSKEDVSCAESVKSSS